MTFKSKILIKSQNTVGTEIASELSGSLYAVVRRNLSAENLEKTNAVLIDNTADDMDEALESLILSGKSDVKTFVLTNDAEPLISDNNGVLFISAKLGTENICRLIGYCLNVRNRRQQAEKATSKLLLDIGFQTSLKGFRYVTEAVALIIENPDATYRFNSRIYPIIAEKHGMTRASVERAVRNSIELAYDKNYLKFEEFFGCSDSKPSNTDFISFCAEKIRIELF